MNFILLDTLPSGKEVIINIKNIEHLEQETENTVKIHMISGSSFQIKGDKFAIVEKLEEFVKART